MNVTIFLYHNAIAKGELHLKRCEACNRPLFKYSATEMVIANVSPGTFTVYEPGAIYIEHICHGCGSQYSILFQ